MNATDRQQVIDSAKLVVNEYFDHYLTEVFPQQMDRMFEEHNRNIEAHPVQFRALGSTKRKVDRVAWMIAGVSVLFGAVMFLATLWGKLDGLVK